MTVLPGSGHGSGWRLLGALLLAAVLVFVSAAAAKDFRPGDLRVCNAKRCVSIVKPNVLPTLGSFYYSGGQPPTARAPRLGAPMFELRFRNGYATGIVATGKLDRFLSYGVNLDRFRRGTWYRVPARLALELRRLTARLEPMRLTRIALAKSR
jgi:hypothetical protein